MFIESKNSELDFVCFNFEIKNIEDVITKYDQILSVVATWPTEAGKKYFRGQNGTDYNVYVSKQLKADSN